MILPTKHITVSESLFGLGATVLAQLSTPASPSRLWERVRMVEQLPSYPRFVLALDMLYAVGAVEFDAGLLRRRKPGTTERP